MSERAEHGGYTAEARRAGAVRAASLEGLDLALGGLDGLAAAMEGPEMEALVAEHTDLMLQDARSRARFGRTGRYREAIRAKVFANPDGFVGAVFVIQGPWARKLSVLWPKNLPLWLEYGTRKMDAKPHLLPAFHAAKERLSRAVERLIGQKADA